MTELLTALSLYFTTDCERYLVQDDPRALEAVSLEDLSQTRLVTKARLYLYDHPLDRVVLRLVEQEMVARQILNR